MRSVSVSPLDGPGSIDWNSAGRIRPWSTDEDQTMNTTWKAAALVAAGLTTAIAAGAQTPGSAPNQDAVPPETGITVASITLGQAIERAFAQAPGVVGAALAAQSAEALARQARRFPNPELFFDLEEAGGTGSLSGLDSAELTAGLTQVVEVGGDRRARMRVASAVSESSELRLDLARRDLVREVTISYYELLAGQERFAVADSLHALASRFHDTVTEQVAAGKASPLDERRALVLTSNTALERSDARIDLVMAQTHLSATLGDPEPVNYEAVGALESDAPLPDPDLLVRAFEAGPHAMLWEKGVEAARNRAQLVRSERIPNVTVSVGGRRYRELGESAVTGTIAIPIPLLDRGTDAVRAADLAVSVEETKREDAFLQMRSRLASLAKSVELTEEGITELRDRAIPAAQANLAATMVGYREGKFDLTTVIGVERTLTELAMKLVDARLRHRLLHAEIDRIAAERGTDRRTP